ncbi:hypothetical protein BDV98DRAFT_605064, partial [Pterulicium gracile]
MSSVEPELSRLEMSCDWARTIAEIVRRHDIEALFIFPEDYVGATIDSVVFKFGRRYVRSSPTYRSDSMRHLHETLDWCYKMELLPLIPVALEFVTSLEIEKHNNNSNELEDMFLRLLPQLLGWGIKHDLLDVVSPYLLHIMSRWIEENLDITRRSVPVNASKKIKVLRDQWTYQCKHCTSTKDFLVKATRERSLRQTWTSEKERKHVEQHLQEFAKGVASSKTIKFKEHKYAHREELVLEVTKTKGVHGG